MAAPVRAFMGGSHGSLSYRWTARGTTRTEDAFHASSVTPSGRSAKEELEAAVRAATEADRRFAEQLMSRPASDLAACADELVPWSWRERRRKSAEVEGTVELMRGPMDSLFTTKLLSSSEEQSLGRLAQKLLAIERAREALLDERSAEYKIAGPARRPAPRAGGRKGVRIRDPVTAERRAAYASSSRFRGQWASLCNCSSVAELDERVAAGRAARQALVAANMRLVYALAKRHEGHGVGFSDLVQEGAIGLMRAATKFDPDRGYKFSTYAYHWIRQALLRALASDSRLIRLPMYVHDELVRLTRCRSAFLWNHGREPTDLELCDQLDLSPDKLRRLDSAVRCSVPVSTDSFVKADTDKNGASQSGAPTSRSALRVFDDASGPTSYLVAGADGKLRKQRGLSSIVPPIARKSNRDLKVSDTLADNEPSSETNVDYSLMHNAIEEALQHLTPDEQNIIRQRFGLDDGVTRSCSQIAKFYSETKEWVKSIESSALRKLRHPHSRSMLQPHQEAYAAQLTL